MRTESRTPDVQGAQLQPYSYTTPAYSHFPKQRSLVFSFSSNMQQEIQSFLVFEMSYNKLTNIEVHCNRILTC